MSGDVIDPTTVMKQTAASGPCPVDCSDTRKGPHWHDYLRALREAGVVLHATTHPASIDESDDEPAVNP